MTDSLPDPVAELATISSLVKLPSPLASRTTYRSMSSPGSEALMVAWPACETVNGRLTLAVDGSLGLSCRAVSVVTLGWLRPNPSATTPGRSRPALRVTSKLPVSAVAWTSTWSARAACRPPWW